MLRGGKTRRYLASKGLALSYLPPVRPLKQSHFRGFLLGEPRSLRPFGSGVCPLGRYRDMKVCCIRERAKRPFFVFYCAVLQWVERINGMGTSSKKQKNRKKEGRSHSAITGRHLAEARRLADDLCEGEGLELVHMETVTEFGQTILRLYIDKEGGVSLGDCTNVSRQLGDLMDVSLDIRGEYRLEVSSPGLDRPISKPADFDRFKGSMAVITTHSPVEGRSRFKGTLLGQAPGEMVCMDVDGTTHEIALENIKRARLVGNIGES